MYNITKGNVVPMKATLVHDEERFPVGASTGLSVRIYSYYRYIDAVNVVVDQEEDGVLYFDIPATLKNGVYGVEVKGKVNGTPWRTATDCVVKITPSTERNEGSEAVPEGDTYDITMTVQLYKQQSSDRAIEEHNSDEASHPYILGELERIEGEIPTLPEHIVTDANYVHTDNNYTTEEKTKLGNTYTIEQTDEAIEQAKEDVSWEAEEYDITEAGGIGTVSHPRGRVVYFSSVAVSYIRISPLPHNASTGISFKVIGTPTEDTDNFVRISARGSIIFRTSNRPTIFKAGVTYKVEYTYISHDNLGCVYLEAWSGGTSTAAYTGSYNDLSDKPTIPTVPTNVSAFTNNAGYITKTVNDLVNYYLKSEVYTKTEVANLIAAIQQFHYEIYASISAVTSPAGNVLYLIGPTGTGSDRYEEYVYDATKQEPWVKIGDTSIDLSDYYTKGQTDNAITSALNTALTNYTTTTALTLLLAGKQDVINDLASIRSGASAGATAYQKPQGGIPSTDMSSAVQTSLGKADSSLQPTQQTLTDQQKQQARNNIGAAGVDDVPTLPNNVSYFSGDSGDGIVPTNGIRGENIVASSAISVNPDVVTAITGEIGSATTITLVVPNDSLRHVWDMFFTTASDGGATIVVPQGATLHVPSGYSIASGKTYEVRIIGVGNHYYLTCQEYN